MIAPKAGTVVRGLRLTGKGLAVLNAADRVTPEALFTDEQLAAIARAGYRVFFVRAEPLLGLEAAS